MSNAPSWKPVAEPSPDSRPPGMPPRRGEGRAMSQTWTITVCPKCREHTLPAGSFRARCPGCRTYFSRDDERPEDRDHYPDLWERRDRWRYPVPGERVTVAEVPSSRAKREGAEG